MSVVLANGFMVIEATINVPLEGVWHADLHVDGEHENALGNVGVTLKLEEGLELVGFGRRARAYLGRTHVRVVGGAGGLSKALEGQHYRSVSGRIVATDIATGAGEAIDDRSSLSAELAHFTRIRNAAGLQLRALAEELGQAWRMTLEGKLLIGTIATTDSKLRSEEILNRDGINGFCHIARFVDAGVTILGEKVVRSVTTIRTRETRSTVYLADAA